MLCALPIFFLLLLAQAKINTNTMFTNSTTKKIGFVFLIAGAELLPDAVLAASLHICNIEDDAYRPQNFACSCCLQRGAQRTLMHYRAVVVEDECNALAIYWPSAFRPRQSDIRKFAAWLPDTRIERALVSQTTHFSRIKPHCREMT